MAVRIDRESFTLQFQKKITLELAILNQKLSTQLRDEITQTLYSSNDVNKEENDILKRLENLKRLYKQVTNQPVTPESDVYLTPQASPSEVHCGLHTRCFSDSVIDDEFDSLKEKSLKKNNALYYSLVPIDEVFDSDCSGVLEKELAEQDELLKSFKSILSKERKSTKTKRRTKPTSLSLTSSLNPKHNTNINDSVQRIYSKRKSSAVDFKTNHFSNTSKESFCVQELKNLKIEDRPVSEIKKSEPTRNSEEEETSKFSCSQSTNFDSSLNSNTNRNVHPSTVSDSSCLPSNMNKIFKIESSHKESDDAMSNPETEAIGQDSVLDAGSSGYVTGSSPRDHTVSETFGVDVTEAASSEDIPHDNDRSAASSSVSSDVGTWDSTFPATQTEEELAFNQQQPQENKRPRDRSKNAHQLPNHQEKPIDDHCTGPNKNCANLPDLVQIESSINNVDLFEPTQQVNPKASSHHVSECKALPFENHSREKLSEEGFSERKTIVTTCKEIVSESSHSNQDSDNCLNSNSNDNSNCISSKNNFFIDASSLLDESELAPVQVTKITFNQKDNHATTLNAANNFENQTITMVDVTSKNSPENMTCVNGDKTEINSNKDRNDDTKLSPDIGLTFEERRSSLIRRNTFELEPDDGKLAKLQQEFEKRKDTNDCKDIVVEKCSKLNPEQMNHKDSKPTKKQSPDSLFIVSKNQTQIQDDEMHSPDSLNNDAPLEAMFEDRNEDEKRRILEKVNRERIDKLDQIQDTDYDSSKLYNSGLFYNVENTLDQCFKYDTKLNFDKDDSSLKFDIQSENGSSSRMSDCSSTLSRGSACIGSADRLNRIESMPIVSGGASISDFSPPVSCASPLTRRKTEFAPILSGGSVLIPDFENDQKPKPKSNNVFTASWVVDMSDAVKSPEMKKKKRTDSGRSSGSSEHTDLNDDISSSKSDQKSVMKTSNPALGFFIPLDDVKPERVNKQNVLLSSQTKSTESQDSKSGSQNNINSSCGFYIDLTKNSDQLEPLKDKPIEKNAIPPDKKLFSMFIDISETSSTKSTENVSPKSKTSSPNLFSNKKLKPKTHASRFHSKHDDLRSSDSQLSSESSIELSEHPEVARGKHLFSDQLNCTPPPSRQISTNENSTMDLSQHESRKKGFFMFIEAENFSPVARRKTLPSGLRPNSQRHSWNLETKNVNHEHDSQGKKEHKRAHSVSVDRTLTFNVSCDEKKSSSVTSLVKNSSKEFSSGVFDSGPASIDEAVIRSSERSSRAMISSWHGPVKPSSELQKVLSRSERKDMRESKTVIGLSKTLENNKQKQSQNTENSETSLSFKSDETYDVRSESMLSDLSSCSHKGNNSTFIVNDVSNVANATSNELELSTPSHEIISELSKDESDPSVNDVSQTEILAKDNGFTKDTKVPTQHISQPLQTVKEETKGSFVKLSDMDKEPAKLVLETRKTTTNRMSRSIPEASWIESRIMTRSATSRSLGRLFPHLNVRSPDKDDINFATDVSEMSSLQSSMEPSALEGSTEDTEASSSLTGPCSRLGEDLLRMFLEEISTDVTVEVGGRRIKAHKCILSSRCQYFAAMLSGGWVESAGNVISLQGFSYNAVHFALCHIYSGTSNIPDSINIVELATLADMLCLEGLKEVIMYTLKVKYCHFFHKPCPLCTVGVLECLPLAAAYGLDEIYRKSLRWIAKYFVRVWPTKGFATLPRELVDKCFKQHVVHMSVENVLDTVMCCEKLEATIPQVRWADPVFAVTQRLHETAVKFISQHFSGVLSSELFLSFGKDASWSLDRLKKTLLSVADKLSPDQACRSHSRLHTILTVAESTSPPPEMIWSEEFLDLLRQISSAVENSLIKQASRAVRTPAWTQMDPQLRHRIQNAACLVIVPGDDRRRARHASLLRRSEDRTSSSSGLRSSDLHQVKVAMSQQNVGRKNTSDSTAAPAPATTTKAVNRSSLPNGSTTAKPSRSNENSTKTKSWPHRLAEVKSRYLEQRAPVKANQNSTTSSNTTAKDKCWSVPAQRKNMGKAIISSSDSSRTSSPAMRRSLGNRASRSLFSRDAQRKESETLSMSTDSLVETSQQIKPSGNKVKSDPPSVEINGNARAHSRSEKRQVLTNKIDVIKTKSAESLSKVNGEAKPLKSHSVAGSQNIISKEGNKLKSSPIPLTKKNNNQISPRIKESPIISRAKPMVNSVGSPAMRRNNTTSQNNQQTAKSSELKSTTVKRNSTYRVQNRTPLSPTKVANKAKEPQTVSTATNRININNNPRLQKAANNNTSNTSSPLLNRVKPQPQLTVGSRSGTFLKDEPTVLRKPQPAHAE